MNFAGADTIAAIQNGAACSMCTRGFTTFQRFGAAILRENLLSNCKSYLIVELLEIWVNFSWIRELFWILLLLLLVVSKERGTSDMSLGAKGYGIGRSEQMKIIRDRVGSGLWCYQCSTFRFKCLIQLKVSENTKKNICVTWRLQ
jgi:hypothetical protein